MKENNKNERIQKIISNYGSYSRREIEKLIKDKLVKIDGEIAKLGDKANINSDIRILNKKLTLNLKQEYYVLNKPKGYICSRVDEKNKTAISLINNYKNKNIFSIGRLDVNTTGLLIITNDGYLSNYITLPKNKIRKTYLVWYQKKLTKENIFNLKNGIKIDENYITKKLANLKVIDNEKKFVIRITLIEGKNNQIKKMFIALENKVINLKRIQIEDLKLNSLEIGKYKKYSKQEIYNFLNVRENKNEA
ncbi:MAG: ribosomal large subunit pseudouridine synthase B [Candidatus Hepatoplasma vulgare]|nr:MAG: ribosomal large subunit pseudouridine synthase B [Candidatus Hepatoplasma sp.]